MKNGHDNSRVVDGDSWIVPSAVDHVMVAPSDAAPLEVAYLVSESEVDDCLAVVGLDHPALVVHADGWVLTVGVHVFIASLECQGDLRFHCVERGRR